jgi:hypothetical protein
VDGLWTLVSWLWRCTRAPDSPGLRMARQHQRTARSAESELASLAGRSSGRSSSGAGESERLGRGMAPPHWCWAGLLLLGAVTLAATAAGRLGAAAAPADPDRARSLAGLLEQMDGIRAAQASLLDGAAEEYVVAFVEQPRAQLPGRRLSP